MQVEYFLPGSNMLGVLFFFFFFFFFLAGE